MVVIHRGELEVNYRYRNNSPGTILSNKELNPVIDKHVISGYYYFTEVENFQYPEEPIIA